MTRAWCSASPSPTHTAVQTAPGNPISNALRLWLTALRAMYTYVPAVYVAVRLRALCKEELNSPVVKISLLIFTKSVGFGRIAKGDLTEAGATGLPRLDRMI